MCSNGVDLHLCDEACPLLGFQWVLHKDWSLNEKDYWRRFLRFYSLNVVAVSCHCCGNQGVSHLLLCIFGWSCERTEFVKSVKKE